jgi:hypothetical protein
MTQDFRQFSPNQQAATLGTHTPASNLAQRIIVASLYASSAIFLLAGTWLLIGEQGLIPRDVAPIFGASLIFVAVTDVMAVFLLKRLWMRRPGGNGH